ncbi:hypothetical protein [Neorhizobium sp. S3-V5DH]|uniref:hypothetical protein n=1 Tax=Neorhizobium sp. S3-V5DH TaxID=2485166 RepID=UPI001053ED49|nr:hypothetical protein [Neorhizobium sp. S3-V5DH]TCV62285.1 hypothetical protein EDE09_12449 [Neorhizobium sp. S3-V5DH]
MKLEPDTHDGVGPVVCPMLPFLHVRQKVGALLELVRPSTVPPTPAEYAGFADVPSLKGYDTAFGFLAKNNPESLDFLDDPITAILEEYEALLTLCSKKGLPCAETTAPSALRERGFNRTFAFPVEILEAHFL